MFTHQAIRDIVDHSTWHTRVSSLHIVRKHLGRVVECGMFFDVLPKLSEWVRPHKMDKRYESLSFLRNCDGDHGQSKIDCNPNTKPVGEQRRAGGHQVRSRNSTPSMSNHRNDNPCFRQTISKLNRGNSDIPCFVEMPRC